MPLVAELGAGMSEAAENCRVDMGASGVDGTAQAALSLGDLLRHPCPPLELLERLKAFAKSARRDPESHLPEDVAAALYALAVAAALVRHGQKITSMPDDALGRYFTWARPAVAQRGSPPAVARGGVEGTRGRIGHRIMNGGRQRACTGFIFELSRSIVCKRRTRNGETSMRIVSYLGLLLSVGLGTGRSVMRPFRCCRPPYPV